MVKGEFVGKEFERLTLEICNEYKERAVRISKNEGNDTAEWRKLRIELQKRCNIEEIETVNIL